MVGVDGTAIEVGDLVGMLGIGEVHDGDAALVPALDEDVTTGDGKERAVVGYAVLNFGLGCRHLVVGVEGELAVGEGEDGVCAPVHRIGCAATGLGAAAPLVGEDDLAAVVAEGGGVPEGEVGVGYGFDTLGVDGVLDVHQDSVAGACAGHESDGSVGGEVVAAADGSGVAGCAVGGTYLEGVDDTGGGVGEDARAVYDFSQLGVGQRDLDDDDGEERGVGVLAGFTA